ncbi:MAG TPA: hypothetical protein VLB27_06220, partial [candidate division Zixibacteria bacterium]|nr:hypothetical protein [candidate division Zixibacteria bacterium]
RRLQAALANLSSAQTGFWISAFYVAAATVAIWFVIKRRAPLTVLLALPALMMVDGIRWGQRFVETVDARKQQQYFSPNLITDFLNQQQGVHRTMQWGIFSGDYLPYFDVEQVSGYHGNQLRWYDELLGGPAQVPNQILRGAALRNITNPRLLNLVGARFLTIPKGSAFPADHFGPEPVRTALDLGQVAIYENPNYFPRAFLVDSLKVFTDRQELVRRVLNGPEDLRRVAIVEEPVSGWNSPTPDDGAASSSDSVWVSLSGQDSIVVGYRTAQPRPLVVSTAYYDAWRPYHGAAPLDVFRVDGAFLGVVAPAGTGEIIFRYKSPRYETGKTITFASLGLTAALLALGWTMGRKRRIAET